MSLHDLSLPTRVVASPLLPLLDEYDEDEEYLTEPTPAQTLKEPEVDSLTTTLEELSIQVSSAPPSGGCLPSLPSWLGEDLFGLSHQTYEEYLTEPAPAPAPAQTLRELDVDSLTTTMEESSIRVLLAPPSGSCLPSLPSWFGKDLFGLKDQTFEEEHLTEATLAQMLKEPGVYSLPSWLGEDPFGLRHQTFEEEHLTEDASAKTLQGQDVESFAATLEGSSMEVSVAPPSGRWRPITLNCSMNNDLTTFEEYLTEHSSAQTLKESNDKSLATTLEKESSEVSPPSRSWLPSSPIRVRRVEDWGLAFHIRVDPGGSFHSYPHVGGPFQSLEEVDSAIDSYLQTSKDPTMCKEQYTSRVDYMVRYSLYWPDGIKKTLADPSRDWVRHVVQALIDDYNDDHNLVTGLAYELKDVLCYDFVRVNDCFRVKYHINFTTKTKGADDLAYDLFFAEVEYVTEKYEELVVSCFCLIRPSDNGYCCGCKAKHPKDAAAYTAGRWATARTCCLPIKDINEGFADEEARLRFIYQGMDDPDYVETMKALMTPLPFEQLKALKAATVNET